MWFRKPKVTLTVEIRASSDIEDVIKSHRLFVDLCMKHNLSISEEAPSPKHITVVGSPRNIARFEHDFQMARAFHLI